MTIPLEKLRNVTTIVSHQNCPDGIASVMILKDVLPKAEVIFLTHGTPEFKALEPKPGMLFCDFTPVADIPGSMTAERLANRQATASDFVAVGAIVLDHHRTARSVVEQFGDLGVFADENAEPGVSGAVLAFREVWLPLAMQGDQRPSNHGTEGRGRDFIERFAKVAGVRDTWQKTHPMWKESCEQAAALRFYPQESWLNFPFFDDSIGFVGTEALERKLAIGEVIVQRRADVDKLIAAGSYFFTTERGSRVAIASTIETSDLAEILDVDLLVGFAYRSGPDGQQVILSTRSRGKFDCARFCKVYGGGGHTSAAGCSVKIGPNDVQPFTYIARFIEQYEMVVTPV